MSTAPFLPFSLHDSGSLSRGSARRISRGAAALMVAGAVVAALAACTDGGEPGSSPAGSASPSDAASASPSASPSTPSTSTANPVDLECLDLVSLDAMYDFDPNFGLQQDYSPAAGSPAATSVGSGGVACSWLQQTSGDTIEISVAQPDAAALADLRAAAGADSSGTEFFSSTGDVGTIQAFTGPYWVVATSTYFLAVEDARPLLDSVESALG